VPHKEIRHLKDIDWPVVTVILGTLLLQFRRWRDELQVHVAPLAASNELHELSLVLSMIDTSVARQSSYLMSDVARWLRLNIDRIEDAFSEIRYPETKQRLSEVYGYDRAVTRQWENGD